MLQGALWTTIRLKSLRFVYYVLPTKVKIEISTQKPCVSKTCQWCPCHLSSVKHSQRTSYRVLQGCMLMGSVHRVMYPTQSAEEQPLSHKYAMEIASWLAGMNLTTIQPACIKTYAGPLREGRAAMVNSASGDRLTVFWDTRLNDTLGVWLTRGGWHGHHHVALEPSNGCPDDLLTAAARGRCGVISANATLDWKVAIQIDSGGKS